MALKRLDEEFELKPGTQLLPYMKRLLPSLEGRFQALESERETIEVTIDDVRAVALQRINEILIPATEDIQEVTTLGFLLGPSNSSVKLELGVKTFVITEGAQRNSFTPSPYVLVERTVNITDYAIARVLNYDQTTGILILNITAWHGNQGPWTDWVISSTPGMADSTKIYHDAVGPMYDQIVIDAAQVAADKIEIAAAIDALEAAGLDANAFIRRDGTVPFVATQRGVTPAAGTNDTTIVTAAWARARMIEYLGSAVQKTGDTMSGPLYLSRDPVGAAEAATKAYVDSIIGVGGVMQGSLTINASNPMIRLRPTGAQQTRYMEAVSSGNVLRWQLQLADNALESGANAGADFGLHRYADNGTYLGPGLQINRASGLMTTQALNVTGQLNVTGGARIAGDIYAYRPAAANTGVIFLNSAGSAYHFFDGANHVLTGGGLSLGANSLTAGHLSTYSLTTNGYAATVWGITVHGVSTLNNDVTISGALTLTGRTANYITLYDTDWGPMHIHHNQDLIGFLNNGGGWAAYVTNAGHIWAAQYGWLHDYINQQASAYAWSAADTRYNQVVYRNRWLHAGDLNTNHGGGAMDEPYTGAAITGFAGQNGYAVYVTQFRFRRLQMQINGSWSTVGYN